MFAIIITFFVVNNRISINFKDLNFVPTMICRMQFKFHITTELKYITTYIFIEKISNTNNSNKLVQ